MGYMKLIVDKEAKEKAGHRGYGKTKKFSWQLWTCCEYMCENMWNILKCCINICICNHLCCVAAMDLRVYVSRQNVGILSCACMKFKMHDCMCQTWARGSCFAGARNHDQNGLVSYGQLLTTRQQLLNVTCMYFIHNIIYIYINLYYIYIHVLRWITCGLYLVASFIPTWNRPLPNRSEK
jgi:hypothetical protein